MNCSSANVSSNPFLLMISKKNRFILFTKDFFLIAVFMLCFSFSFGQATLLNGAATAAELVRRCQVKENRVNLRRKKNSMT